MSSNRNRQASRGALAGMKTRLVAAQKGHSLLKKKRDALQMRFRMILSKIISTKSLMGETMKAAALSLAEAKYTSGNCNFNASVIANVNQAQMKIKTRQDNVAGVTLSLFECYQDGVDSYELTGLARGGQQMSKLKRNYQTAIKLLVELASLQTSFATLDDVIKLTSRRVNAIEHVIIPSIEKDLSYILSELDELEREDFFRLKKVQNKKRLARKNADAIVKARNILETDPSNMLNDFDEDMLF